MSDERDHDGYTVFSFARGYHVICDCGWSTDCWPNESEAEIEHGFHVELETQLRTVAEAA